MRGDKFWSEPSKISSDINIKTATSGFTPLFWAATSNQKNIDHLLIKKGADVNAKGNKSQETALHEMFHQGKLEIAKFCLKVEPL